MHHEHQIVPISHAPLLKQRIPNKAHINFRYLTSGASELTVESRPRSLVCGENGYEYYKTRIGLAQFSPSSSSLAETWLTVSLVSPT